MSWASLLKAGGKAAKWLGKGVIGTIEATGKAALHPASTIKAAGTAVKTAAVGAGLGYVGWKKLTTDESVVGIVSDAIIGEKGTESCDANVRVLQSLARAGMPISTINQGAGKLNLLIGVPQERYEDAIRAIYEFRQSL